MFVETSQIQNVSNQITWKDVLCFAIYVCFVMLGYVVLVGLTSLYSFPLTCSAHLQKTPQFLYSMLFALVLFSLILIVTNHEQLTIRFHVHFSPGHVHTQTQDLSKRRPDLTKLSRIWTQPDSVP